MLLHASSLDFKQWKGREGKFRPGATLFKASHYKLRKLLPSDWNDSQICGLLKRYCRRLIAAMLPELFETLHVKVYSMPRKAKTLNTGIH